MGKITIRPPAAKRKTGMRRKIVLFICLAISIVAFTGIGIGYFLGFNLLSDTIGRDNTIIAQNLAVTVSGLLENAVKKIDTYFTTLPVHREAALESGLKYKDKDASEIKEYLLDMDKKWARAAPDSPLLAAYLKGKSAQRLKYYTLTDKTIAEVFTTDKFGGLAAASGKTSDFYQADEEWWQAAYNGGKGAVYIGDIEYDESSGVTALPVAVPIRDEKGGVDGVCKAVLNVGVLFEPLKNFKMGRTGHAVLADNNGFIIFHAGITPLSQRLCGEKEFKSLMHNAKKWGILKSPHTHKEDMFVSFAAIEHPLRAGRRIIGWVFVDEEAQEVFLPLKILFVQMAVVVGTILIIFLPVAFIFGGMFVKPIETLREASERIGMGKMDYPIEVKTGDEIEELADSFRRMTESLQKTMVSRDALTEEIDERQKAEALATYVKAEWEDTFDSISDTITIHDLDFNILRANKAAESMFGLAFKDFLNTKCYKNYHKRDSPVEGCPGRNVLETGKVSVAEMYEPSLGIYVEIKAFPRLDGKKNLRGVIHIVRDITERKKIEEDIRKAKDGLEKQAGALDEQLKGAIKSREIMVSMLDDNNRIRDELEKKLDELEQTQLMLIQSEKLASLGRLVADMAHEVNNPLMIISGNAQLSLLDGSLSEELKNNLGIIHEECNRAKDIIQRLLMFSRPGKGERKPLDINRSIESVAKLLEHQFGLSNVKMSLQSAGDLPLIVMDEKQFQEVVMNLVNNARDAMPEGGEIAINTSLDGAYLKAEIKDSGVGMDDMTLTRIFEPFFTTKEKGTGLGLSVCYGIIKGLNGKIQIDSQPQKGTTVHIWLPIAGGGI